jgi:uncharacterized membrane protein
MTNLNKWGNKRVVLNLPDAIALSTLLVMGGAMYIKSRVTENGAGNGTHVTERLCRERHGSLKEELHEARRTQEKIFNELKEIRKEIQGVR